MSPRVNGKIVKKITRITGESDESQSPSRRPAPRSPRKPQIRPRLDLLTKGKPFPYGVLLRLPLGPCGRIRSPVNRPAILTVNRRWRVDRRPDSGRGRGGVRFPTGRPSVNRRVGEGPPRRPLLEALRLSTVHAPCWRWPRPGRLTGEMPLLEILWVEAEGVEAPGGEGVDDGVAAFDAG